MERNRIIPETERQQKQLQQERERQENQCNAALAVKKHFEESLRRAKEKQMQAWTINSIPPTSQQQPTYQQHYFISNRKSPSLTQTMPIKVSEISNEFPVKRVFLTQNKNSAYFNSKNNISKEQFHQSSQATQIIQPHMQHQNLPSQPTALHRIYSNDSTTLQSRLPQQLPPYMNAQSKPRVSSPAPSKIYVCPELKIRTLQERRSFTEPPPAHSNYLLPQHSLPSQDLSLPNATSEQASTLSCSPRIHIPISLEVANAVQLKPLDLGFSDRHRNDGVVVPTEQTVPPFAAESNENASNDLIQTSVGNIKMPHITVVTPQIHSSNSMKPNDVDDNSSNLINNDRDNSEKHDDTEVISNRFDGDDKSPTDDKFARHSSIKIPSPSSWPSPNSMQSAPTTTDYEKSLDITVVAPMHLKKAWLQRHTGATSTGEECDNTINSAPTTSTTTPASTASTTANSAAVKEQENPSKSSSNPSSNICKSKLNSITTRTGITGQNSDSSSSDQTANIVNRRSKRRKIEFLKSAEKKKASQGTGIARRVASGSDRESGDSDKESLSDNSMEASQSKEVFNDVGENSTDAPENKETGATRKRGRRPKDVIVKKKKITYTKKPPLFQLKRTGEPFLQDGSCFEVAPKLSKCRECRWIANQKSKNTSNIFCRFLAFRKLRYTKTGMLAIAGFSDPYKDPTDEDLKLWMPDADNPPKNLDLIQARFLLAKVADQFCDLFFQEKMAMPENMSSSKVVAWKRVVQGVREMCDVCQTSLFNYHWACSKCGFVVCIDCYKARKYGENKVWNNEWNNGETDEYSWLFCTNRSAHIQERLMLTQIIAGDSLQVLARRIHQVRALWKIPQNCACLMSREEPIKATNGVCKELIQSILNDNKLNQCDKVMNFSSSDSETNCIKTECDAKKLNETALTQEVYKRENLQQSSERNEQKVEDDSSDDGSSLDENHSTLRDLLIGPTSNMAATSSSPPNEQCDDEQQLVNTKSAKISHKQLFDEMMANTLESVKKKVDNDHLIVKKKADNIYSHSQDNEDLINLDLISNQPRRNRYLPIRVMTMALSQELYPDVKHMWLCEGKLLRLLDPADNANNLKIFQQQWKRGQPVLVSHVDKCLNIDLWRPDSFSRDFGEDGNDLVNCLTGTLVPNQPMKRFWDGFDCINKRIKDENGEPMLLKLKDWPPGEDFSETLPTRYTDLMKSLPLCEYTKRNGKFNLASRLPECFVKPDLGPKMYNAYGSASHPTKGTTNLHLDISDAVNVMVYVGIPKDTADNHDSIIKEAYRAIDEAGCDILQRRRVREKNELPGALWHIFAPRDANKIRDLLNKVAIERGERLEPSHDAIHDQSWYLDSKLRERLYREYGVEGYSIAQCLGDAVFIPAGAPHQVRNLLNCIKVAEDFVSPENVSECFHLTQEFRSLSDTHSNHEDKLQIKNIIYHAAKDALSLLSHVLDERIAKEQGFDLKQAIKQEFSDESDLERTGF
ncbi:lysine-specific demethylase 3A isoform X2 [Sitodiplosis mosellana]|uniref:lysine-specific demethylase 3A isoform X2 n=1 Tax=Sitodiplosis mosellana TaxID=263140 RepID=UPI002443BCBF|nr:lysine-specific demethylase 3A isoform X2 [Sitodiplosis mosellana]XP_055310782.1 lysine-specific demethylase 3A isoform X2 [Sitodiplosis mosellana]XP_055310783.1 lysine-specific demethylase 3A isoform X2 [Sitodiplosis mosellana]XP_055310784.1 lysine-specific demethylase 3A isoform X2 [Sitodiplosis mosellana]XP_055310786.1 lysine-specific demethylase 3A isoform X2 [Sitodiplosis mosellana]XP_055310787.1 lysine-specific demethylase 3A isoform X2 [Sitodiplosis mosellana]